MPKIVDILKNHHIKIKRYKVFLDDSVSICFLNLTTINVAVVGRRDEEVEPAHWRRQFLEDGR